MDSFFCCYRIQIAEMWSPTLPEFLCCDLNVSWQGHGPGHKWLSRWAWMTLWYWCSSCAYQHVYPRYYQFIYTLHYMLSFWTLKRFVFVRTRWTDRNPFVGHLGRSQLFGRWPLWGHWSPRSQQTGDLQPFGDLETKTCSDLLQKPGHFEAVWFVFSFCCDILLKQWGALHRLQ